VRGHEREVGDGVFGGTVTAGLPCCQACRLSCHTPTRSPLASVLLLPPPPPLLVRVLPKLGRANAERTGTTSCRDLRAHGRPPAHCCGLLRRACILLQALLLAWPVCLWGVGTVPWT